MEPISHFDRPIRETMENFEGHAGSIEAAKDSAPAFRAQINRQKIGAEGHVFAQTP